MTDTTLATAARTACTATSPMISTITTTTSSMSSSVTRGCDSETGPEAQIRLKVSPEPVDTGSDDLSALGDF